MMMSKLFVLGLTFVCLTAPAAQAQVQVDVSKITCEQYVLFKVADPQSIAIWLNGYRHGQSGDTIVDTQRFKDNADKLKRYCYSNTEKPIMQAVEALFGPGK
jgi:acid stress chaperone HdeB